MGKRDTNLNIEAIAIIAHEANRALGSFFGEQDKGPWEDCHYSTHFGAIEGVKAVKRNPEITPEENHAKWVESIKEIVDDPNRYPGLSGTLSPFEDLHPKDQLKNKLFVAIVNALT